MPALQIWQVLDTLGSFHRSMAARYESLSRRTDDERIRLLLTDIAQRERTFADAVFAFEREGPDEQLDVWLQFLPEGMLDAALDAVPDDTPSSLEEAVGTILQIDRSLGEAYRSVANETDVETVRELFLNLAQLDEINDRHYSQMLHND